MKLVREYDRRRGKDLRRSLQNPHRESIQFTDAGLEAWLSAYPRTIRRHSSVGALASRYDGSPARDGWRDTSKAPPIESIAMCPTSTTAADPPPSLPTSFSQARVGIPRSASAERPETRRRWTPHNPAHRPCAAVSLLSTREHTDPGARSSSTTSGNPRTGTPSGRPACW